MFPESPVGALGLGGAAAGVVAAAGLAAALDAAGAVFMPLDADAIAAGVADTGSVVPEVVCVAVLVIAEVVVTAPSLLAAASTEFVALPPAWIVDAAVPSGLACRHGQDWQLQTLSQESREPGTSAYRTAGTPMSPAILSAVERQIAGEPLDRAGESTARRRGWKSVGR